MTLNGVFTLGKLPVDAGIEALRMLGLVVLRLLDALLTPLERIRDYIRAEAAEPFAPPARTPSEGANVVTVPSNGASSKVCDGARAAMTTGAAASVKSRK